MITGESFIMNANAKINELNNKLKDIKADHGWEADNGQQLHKGQVWTVGGDCGDQPAWHWLLLEIVEEDNIVNAAPICPHGELAGPDDLFIPIDCTGLPGIVSFELECSLSCDALGECLGRLPREVFEYVLAARRDMDDEAARISYNWGMSYFSPKSPSLNYHEAIAHRIEQLQKSVRDSVYGETKEPVPFSDELRRTFVLQFFASYLVKPAAAAGNEAFTQCALIPVDSNTSEIAEAAESENYWAKILTDKNWDDLDPDREEDICCEWFLEKEKPPRPVKAVVYADVQETPIGHAETRRTDNGISIILNSFHLEPGTGPITDPEKLRILIYVAKEE